MDIKEQVLSIENMRKLQLLGTDLSSASHFYVRAVRMEGFRKNNCLDRDMAEWKLSLQNHFPVAAAWKVESVPALNSDDIVRILPSVINFGGVNNSLVINCGEQYVAYCAIRKNIIVNTLIEFSIGERLVDSLYRLLLWYLDNKEKLKH